MRLLLLCLSLAVYKSAWGQLVLRNSALLKPDTLEAGVAWRGTLVLVNTGLVPLQLLPPEPECGLNVSTYTSTAIKPGFAAQVSLQLATKGRMGIVTKTLSLPVAGQVLPLQLPFQLVIVPPPPGALTYHDTLGALAFEQQRLAVGEMVAGMGEATFRFKNIGSSTIYLLNPQGVVQGFAWQATPDSIVPAQQGKVVVQALAADSLTPYQYPFLVTIPLKTNDSQLPVKQLSLAGYLTRAPTSKPAMLVLTPAELQLGRLLPGQRLNLTARVRNLGTQLLQVQQVRTVSPGLKIKSFTQQLAPLHTGTVQLQLIAPQLRGNFHQTVSLTTNDPAAPELVLHLRGQVQ